MNSGAEPVDWDSPIQLTGEWVTVHRALSRDGDEVIASMEVTSDGDEPVEVEVSDAIPEAWAVSEVGVHPQHKPQEHSAERTGFVFSDTVDSDTTLEIVYGVKIGADGDVEPPGPPEITAERVASDDDASNDDLLGGEVGVDIDGLEAAVVGEAVTKPEPDDQEGGRIWAGDTPDREPPSEFTRSPSRSIPSQTPPDDGSEFGEFEPAIEDTLKGPTKSDRHLAEELVDELQSGAVTEETMVSLRSALDMEAPKREQVRLDHLQSRVEEFAAYSDTLGVLIDEYGALDEFLSDLDTRLVDLEGGLADLGDTVDEAVAGYGSMDERLGTIEDRVDTVEHLADEIEAVHGDLDQLRRHHGDDIKDLEAALDDIETTLDGQIAALSSNVDALRDDLEGWDATRRRLVDALAPDNGPGTGGSET